MKKKQYTPEQRAEFVERAMALKADGKTADEISDALKIPTQTLYTWVAKSKGKHRASQAKVIVHNVVQRKPYKIKQTPVSSEKCYMVMGTPEQLAEMLLKVR